jgi:hypothetical protein
MRSNALWFSLLLAACGPSAGDFVDGGGGGPGRDGGGGPNEFADAAPAEECQKMDIVFVVDNSGSMVEEQSALAASFPQFITVLDNYMTASGDLLDYRIAVTTTGATASPTFVIPGFPAIPMPQSGDDGAFRTGCGMTGKWLERSDPDVTGKFQCLADVGTGGPSVEMQLYATKLALTRTDQADFARDDALLAFVILSDEDDCSVEDNVDFTIQDDTCMPAPPEMASVDSYIDFFDTLTGDRGRWAAAVIAGDSTCPDAFRDGIRLREFVDKAGDNVIHSKICVSDLSAALGSAIETFEAACDSFPPIP